MLVDDRFYVDIKVSECRSSDNTNAKKAIYYLLTGKPPDEVPDQESIFFAKMKENERADETRDFYFLVVNKLNTGDVFVVSLKGLSHVVPSTNNQPFQSNWGRCHDNTDRDWNEAKSFLLTKWAESQQKVLDKYAKGMVRYYPQFFEDKYRL